MRNGQCITHMDENFRATKKRQPNESNMYLNVQPKTNWTLAVWRKSLIRSLQTVNSTGAEKIPKIFKKISKIIFIFYLQCNSLFHKHLDWEYLFSISIYRELRKNTFKHLELSCWIDAHYTLAHFDWHGSAVYDNDQWQCVRSFGLCGKWVRSMSTKRRICSLHIWIFATKHLQDNELNNISKTRQFRMRTLTFVECFCLRLYEELFHPGFCHPI